MVREEVEGMVREEVEGMVREEVEGMVREEVERDGERVHNQWEARGMVYEHSPKV